MKGKDSGENKGFAFVTFRNVELASKAIEELNNTEFKVIQSSCALCFSEPMIFWDLVDLVVLSVLSLLPLKYYPGFNWKPC